MRIEKKRFIGAFLVFCMIISTITVFPTTVMAENSETVEETSMAEQIENAEFIDENEIVDETEYSETVGEEEFSLAEDVVATEEPVEDLVTEGFCGANKDMNGENIRWKFEGDTLTISGTGKMTDYETKDEIPWYNESIRYSIKNIVIINDIKSEDDDITDLENGIANIGKNAFRYCRNLTSVTMPDSVLSIGDYAFLNCESLVSIEIPDSVKKIERNVFKNCTSLSNVKLSKKLEFIGYGAFRGCTALTEIEIPKNLTQSENNTEEDVPFGVFTDSGLKTVNFEYGVTCIAPYLFSACETLESITIPDTVTVIGDQAFYYCRQLKEVVLNQNLLEIGNWAFRWCDSLGSINIPDSVYTIGRCAFCGCLVLSDVKLPKYLETIGYGAFHCCFNLKEIEIPKNLKTAEIYNKGDADTEYGVFTESGLTTVKFEEGTTAIADCLFALSPIKTITIPDTVTDIKKEAFYKSDISEVIWFDNLLNIGAEAFRACKSLETIAFPQTLQTIGEQAFRATVLKEVAFPEKSLTTIGDSAFRACYSIVELYIPDSVKSIGVSVFRDCTSLKTIKLPSSRKNITKEMFYNCKELRNITLPESVLNIQDFAFFNCESLRNLEFPEGLLTIKQSAFYGCITLVKAIIPKNVNTIGNDAFYNCEELAKVEINGDATIGANAFYDCDLLKTVVIKGGGTIGTKAFYDCDAMESLKISDKVTAIGTYMCYGCEALKELKLSRSISEIPDSAFRLCASLETVTIPRSCTKLATNAFAEDAKLTDVYIPKTVKSIESNTFSYPNKMTIYGEANSYAQKYAESREITFESVDVPIVEMEYEDASVTLAKNATETPFIDFLPEFNTDEITYSSKDEDIATVSSSGVIKGVGYGTTTVTATSDSGVVAFIDVIVVRPAKSITLDKTELDMVKGSAETLAVTLTEENNTDVLVWSSDNVGVAKVDASGTVSAVGVGVANITVKAVYGNVSATCVVAVNEFTETEIPATDIILDCLEKRTTKGDKFVLKATVLPENASNRIVEWASLDTDIAEVSGGIVTVKAVGSTKIIARTAGNYVETCNLVVLPKAFVSKLTVTPSENCNLVDISTVNVTPKMEDAAEHADVYLALYNSSNALVDVQILTLTNGSAQVQIPQEGIAEVKAFIWEKDSLMPLAKSAECVVPIEEQAPETVN